MKKMEIFKIVFAVSLSLIFAQSSLFGLNRIEEEDLEAIQEYAGVGAAYRKAALISDIDTNLSIGGEIETSWTHVTENDHTGTSQLGSGTNYPNDVFKIEAILHVDYFAEKAGASMSLKLKNYGGLEKDSDDSSCDYKDGSGTKDKLDLYRAFIWYRFIEEENRILELSVGRQRLKDLFNSYVQFDSRLDGIALRWSDAIEDIFSYYINLGAMVVNTQNDHFAYAAEIGFKDIAATGLYAKYSFIHWRKRGVGDCATGSSKDVSQFKHAISEFTVGYQFEDLLGMPLDIFGSYLWNHAAHKYIGQDDKDYGKLNRAWYVGFAWGQLHQKDDWRVKATYQHVGGQVVPNFDLAGIGLRSYIKNRAESTNYKGFNIDVGYQITDNLSVRAIYSNVRPIKYVDAQKSSGKPVRVNKDRHQEIELDFTYIF